MIAILGVTPIQASTKAAAPVTASKGPVQITVHLYKTTVKTGKSLWYKLELKNIGKKKLHVQDRVFNDPWAMLENCRLRHGLHLEIIDPQGKPLTVRPGGDTVHFDWEPKGDEVLPYSPEEKNEIAALRADWKKRGLTARQQTLALNDWNNKNNEKKNMAELNDPAKQLWLGPGASTATFAWMDRGPDEYAGRSEDDKALLGGYTQLWSYGLFYPGKYRIRAVYDHAQSKRIKALFKKHGRAVDPGWVEFKTPWIDFEVLP